MNTNDLENINKRLLKYHILGFPGVVLLGLGAYGIIAKGDAFLSILNYENVCIGMIVLGACVAGWEATMVYPLLKKKGELKVQDDT